MVGVDSPIHPHHAFALAPPRRPILPCSTPLQAKVEQGRAASAPLRAVASGLSGQAPQGAAALPLPAPRVKGARGAKGLSMWGWRPVWLTGTARPICAHCRLPQRPSALAIPGPLAGAKEPGERAIESRGADCSGRTNAGWGSWERLQTASGHGARITTMIETHLCASAQGERLQQFRCPAS